MFKQVGLALICLLCWSCAKKNVAPTTPAIKFVSGELLVGIDSATTTTQLFAQVNRLGLYIQELAGYIYYTNIGADSIGYIDSVLDTKQYIDTAGFLGSVYANYLTQVVYNTSILWDLTPARQYDFIRTANLLRMADDFSATKYMLLRVPYGQEEYWKSTLHNLPWVKWTELNQIEQINLLGN